MDPFLNSNYSSPEIAEESSLVVRGLKFAVTYLVIGTLSVTLLYLSLLTTSVPLPEHDRGKLDRAIALLENKGFDRETFLLREMTFFRSTDNWLNGLNQAESAYAATNFPFYIITLYPDFFEKTIDDTERAMVLLHEAQHLQGKNEPEAYDYVWRKRHRIGWTQLSHGTTKTYITIAEQTREHSPGLFTCREKVWNDCTELLKVKTQIAETRKTGG